MGRGGPASYTKREEVKRAKRKRAQETWTKARDEGKAKEPERKAARKRAIQMKRKGKETASEG